MRKQDLVKDVASKSNMAPRQVQAVVDATFAAIREAMARGEKVTLTGFGSFEVAERNEREGRNPRTGQKITIGARKVPQFRAGSELKRTISGNGTGKVAAASDSATKPAAKGGARRGAKA